MADTRGDHDASRSPSRKRSRSPTGDHAAGSPPKRRSPTPQDGAGASRPSSRHSSPHSSSHRLRRADSPRVSPRRAQHQLLPVGIVPSSGNALGLHNMHPHQPPLGAYYRLPQEAAVPVDQYLGLPSHIATTLPYASATNPQVAAPAPRRPSTPVFANNPFSPRNQRPSDAPPPEPPVSPHSNIPLHFNYGAVPRLARCPTPDYLRAPIPSSTSAYPALRYPSETRSWGEAPAGPSSSAPQRGYQRFQGEAWPQPAPISEPPRRGVVPSHGYMDILPPPPPPFPPMILRESSPERIYNTAPQAHTSLPRLASPAYAAGPSSAPAAAAAAPMHHEPRSPSPNPYEALDDQLDNCVESEVDSTVDVLKDALKGSIRRIVAREIEPHTQRARAAAAERDAAGLRAQIAERERDDARGERRRLRARLAGHDPVRCGEQLREHRTLHDDYREANRTLKAERDALRAECDALRAERDAVAAERAVAMAERDAVTAERDMLRRLLTEASEGGPAPDSPHVSAPSSPRPLSAPSSPRAPSAPASPRPRPASPPVRTFMSGNPAAVRRRMVGSAVSAQSGDEDDEEEEDELEYAESEAGEDGQQTTPVSVAHRRALAAEAGEEEEEEAGVQAEDHEVAIKQEEPDEAAEAAILRRSTSVAPSSRANSRQP